MTSWSSRSSPVPPRKREKDRRPSTETKVCTREMEEDTPATLDPIPATKKSSGARAGSGPLSPPVGGRPVHEGPQMRCRRPGQMV